MKTHRFFFTIIILSFFAASTFAQTGLQKTFTSVIHPGESNMLFFNLPGAVDVEVWDRNYIRIEIAVKTNLKNEEVFNYLKELGRYEIKQDYNTYYLMVLNIPNINGHVFVNRNELKESFKFKITVPWDMDVDPRIDSDMTMDYSANDNDGNISSSYEIIQ